MGSLFSAILEAFGIDKGNQFIFAVMGYIAAFLVYVARNRRTDPILAIFLAVLGLSFFVFLFTESPRVRGASATLFALTLIAAFIRDSYRRRKSGSR